jgi:hypothetical protein
VSVNSITFELPDWLVAAKVPSEIEPVLDELVEQFGEERVAQTEKELLEKAYWSQGQTVRLRDDNRFYLTPWGNWLIVNQNQQLVNDWLYEQFLSGVYLQASLKECLIDASKVHTETVCFCPADPRFKKTGDDLILASSLLSGKPKFTENPVEGHFVTHLPFYDLAVVAASEPSGEWGTSAHDHTVDERSLLESSLPAEFWLRVEMGGTRLNNNMFVSRIHGSSMDDGRRGLVDGALVVFQYWPKGRRQNKLVVVRGAFHDAETGSYALKQYQADERNEQGEHQEITLHSLNPDKTRYPDIHLKPEQDNDIVVVAEYIQVLGENEYTREPKPVVPEGERDIHDDDLINQRSNSLGGIHQRIFDEQLSDNRKPPADNIACLNWVCLTGEEGGAALEITPLTFLPKFVKKLELHYSDQVDILLASNHRHYSRVKAITPDAAEYRLQPPVDFEEDFEDEFSDWQVSGLNKSSIHWFRVDASGIGRTITGESWSIGSTYRGLAENDIFVDIPENFKTQLQNGWSIIEFELGSEPPEWLSLLIDSNAETRWPLQLSWISTSPVAWQTTTHSKELAIFNILPEPVLSIKLPERTGSKLIPGILVLLHNGEFTETLTFADGIEWQLKLTDLKPGEFVVQVIPVDKSISPEYKSFIVDDSKLLMPTGVCFYLRAVDQSGKDVAQEQLFSKQDWSQAENKLEIYDELTVQLPPHWPLRISLFSSVYITTHKCRANEDGVLDLIDAMIALLPYFKQLSALKIILDAGELGEIKLFHYREFSPAKVKDRLTKLWSEFDKRSTQLLSDAELLTQYWLSPLFEEWGGQLQLMPDKRLLDLPGTSRLFQWVSSEWEEDTVLANHIPVLLFTKESDDILANGGALRVACNKLLIARKLRRMLVTDGLRICELRKNSSLDLNWFDIESMKNDKHKTETWLGELEGGA